MPKALVLASVLLVLIAHGLSDTVSEATQSELNAAVVKQGLNASGIAEVLVDQDSSKRAQDLAASDSDSVLRAKRYCGYGCCGCGTAAPVTYSPCGCCGCGYG